MIDYFGTLGPACADQRVLLEMFSAGMTGVRVNLSHTSLNSCKFWLKNFALAAKDVDNPQLLIDLQGPELRIGNLPHPICLKEDQDVILGEGGIPVPRQLLPLLAKGDEILLDDGIIYLLVTKVNRFAAWTKVVIGGKLLSRKSIAVCDKEIDLPTLTHMDEQNIAIAGEYGVTGVMQPFVRGKADLQKLRSSLDSAGANEVKIFAKIENRRGVDCIKEIMDACDEIVIARGDLANAYSLPELPRIQKYLACKCRGKRRFMVVTQLLASMHDHPFPTRAEVSDIYNAVMDGASSLMLTGETAIGNYPVAAMEMLVKTARQALRD